MLRIVLAVVCVFLFFHHTTDACSCIISHPQSNYCNADFVIKAKVVRKISGADQFAQVAYVLSNIQYFKANPKAKTALKKSKVFTNGNSAACGVELEVNRNYVLAGGVSEGKATIGLCGLNALWRDLPVNEREGIEGGYKAGCKCNIEYCFTIDENCGQPADNKCVMTNFCYSQFSTCAPDECDKCNWKNADGFDECVAEQTPVEG